MHIFYEPHKEFLRKLIAFNVDFILIGGYAVNFHGYNRATGDMDIWLRPDNQNKLNFINLLKEEGFQEETTFQVNALNFELPATFYFGEVPLRIDFLTIISGVKFDDAWNDKVFLPMGEFQIPVLHLHHLILSKISNDRLKDKQDVEELQKIQKLNKK